MKRVHEVVDDLVESGSDKDPQLQTHTRIATQEKDDSGRGDAWLYKYDIQGLVDE